MKTINIYEAKTHLSKVLVEVRKGTPYIIAKAGTPWAVIVPYENQKIQKQQRIGFLQDRYTLMDIKKIKFLELIFYSQNSPL